MAFPEYATESALEGAAVNGLETKGAKLKGTLADDSDAAAGQLPEDAPP